MYPVVLANCSLIPPPLTYLNSGFVHNPNRLGSVYLGSKVDLLRVSRIYPKWSLEPISPQ
jgi:hypothetical protein